jgi:hypothetical protein
MIDLNKITVQHGNHRPPAKPPEDLHEIKACASEWRTILDIISANPGKEIAEIWPRIVQGWTDRGRCSCPHLVSAVISVNDRISDDARRTALMIRVIPLLEGTRATREVEVKRVYFMVNFIVRTQLPTWLRRLELISDAERVKTLAPIIDKKTANIAREIVQGIRTDCWRRYEIAYAEIRSAADAAYAAFAAYAAYAADAADAAYAAFAAYAADAAYAAYAAAAAAAADDLKKVFETAKAVKEKGGSYNVTYAAAKKIADETVGARIKTQLAGFVQEGDDAFVEMIRGAAAITVAS